MLWGCVELNTVVVYFGTLTCDGDNNNNNIKDDNYNDHDYDNNNDDRDDLVKC